MSIEKSLILLKFIFYGEVDNAIKFEEKINQELIGLENYSTIDWGEYLKYGGFLTSLFESNHHIICKNIIEMIGIYFFYNNR